MPGIYGIIGVPEGDTSFINQIGQQRVFDATAQYLELHSAQLDLMTAIFIEEDTEERLEPYTMVGGGRLQKRSGHTQSAAVKGGITYNAYYPIYDLGAQLAFTDVQLALLKINGLQKHLDTVRNMDISTVREEMLYTLFNSSQKTARDEDGTVLTMNPLANGDTQAYPPLPGDDVTATDNHYLESGYAAASISDSNNPYATLNEEIAEHTNDSDIVAFINSDQKAKTEALTDFIPVQDSKVRASANDDELIDIPTNLPGKIIGRVSETWISVWRPIPTNYILALDLMAPGPLKRRIYPAASGLEPGLQLVSKNSVFPFDQSHYRRLEGYGVGNRLSAAVMELGTGGTYTIPTKYQD